MHDQSISVEETAAFERDARDRLKRAREIAGMHPSELAVYVYNSTSAYHDLESCSGELFTNIDLRDLSMLCAALNINTRELFGLEKATRLMSPEELSQKLKSFLGNNSALLKSLEERVNYEIEPVLEDPSQILAWNIECLRNVCAEIGVNWTEALPP